MKIISWNVNGLNSTYNKGLLDFIKKENPDMLCLQETKGSPQTINENAYKIEGYNTYWNRAERKGYSGVLTFSKKKFKPISVINGIDHETDNEGRIITLEFDDFYLINGYFVNSQRGLKRLDLKQAFNDHFLKLCQKLRKRKNIVACGDFNVAHEEIDIFYPDTNHKSAGFTDEERNWFTKYLDADYVDTYREFVKDGGHYTWWSNFANSRAKDIGWRLDYFVVNNEFLKRVVTSEIMPEVMGSDHCPIKLTLN